MIAIRCGLLILLVSPLGGQASAQTIYRWTDARGHTHYSNVPDAIPTTAAAQATTGEELGLLPSMPPKTAAERAQELQNEQRDLERARVEAADEQVRREQRTQQQILDELQRQATRAAEDRVRSLEGELAELRPILYSGELRLVDRSIWVGGGKGRDRQLVPDPRFAWALAKEARLKNELAAARAELSIRAR